MRRGKLRLGVTGCGAVFERHHLPAIRKSRDWKFVAACDPLEARRSWVHSAPLEAPYRTRLPDLVIAWGKRSAIHSRGIRSAAYGEIHWPDGRLTSGRSGGHRDGGWFVAVGPGIPRGSRADGNHIMDIVPTVFRWLEAEPVTGFQGFPIASLLQTKSVRRPTAGSQREHILGSR